MLLLLQGTQRPSGTCGVHRLGKCSVGEPASESKHGWLSESLRGGQRLRDWLQKGERIMFKRSAVLLAILLFTILASTTSGKPTSDQNQFPAGYVPPGDIMFKQH